MAGWHFKLSSRFTTALFTVSENYTVFVLWLDGTHFLKIRKIKSAGCGKQVDLNRYDFLLKWLYFFALIVNTLYIQSVKS